MIGFLLLLGAGLAFFIALASWWTAHRLRHPPRRTDAYALARGAPANPSELPDPVRYEEHEYGLRDADGDVYAAPAWVIPGEDQQGPIVIATPGWGDSKLGVLPRLSTLLPICSLVVAWDPPGLGEGAGACALGVREPALLRDLARTVRAEQGGASDIALLGWSMGAGISIAAASETSTDDRIGAVIAESPYRMPWTPARNVMRNAGYPYRLNVPICFAALGWRLGVGLRWSAFDRAALAKRVKAPLLVVHGSQDDVCPVSDGRDIDRAANRSMLVVVEQGGHNNLWTDDRFRPQAASAVRDFLLSLSAPSGPSPMATPAAYG